MIENIVLVLGRQKSYQTVYLASWAGEKRSDVICERSRSPHAWLPPSGIPKIVSEVPEVLRIIPGRFDGKKHQESCEKIKIGV